MVPKKICILGGTGFVGHHLLHRLVKEGYQVRVLTRHRERHRDLLVLPTVELVEAPNIFDVDTLTRHFRGCDTVINLVGILNSRTHNDHEFRKVHVELPHAVVHACRRNKIKRLLHVSALNADAAHGASYYLRTKGDAESFLQATKDLEITVFRPSVIFGEGDHFLNRFAHLLRRVPFFLPLACPNARMAPIYVGDVVSVIAQSVRDRNTINQRYDLCGPRVYTLKELVVYAGTAAGISKRVVGLGNLLSHLQALVLEFFPGKPFSEDNYHSLRVDSVCKNGFPKVFAIERTPLESVVPLYIRADRKASRVDEYRSKARRAT